LQVAVKTLDKMKAEDILLLDIRLLNGISDYMLLCHADNPRLVKALAESTLTDLKKAGGGFHYLEGFDTYNWVILDFIDVVIHIFHKPAREFYDLERLWSDAPKMDINQFLSGKKGV
jgi:ribosome-associated protein